MHPSEKVGNVGIIGAIPARYASTRLPGKPLLPIAGRPMIEHVYRRAALARGIDRVVVLTDDERIAAAVVGFGGEVEMTPPECASGTDRIAHAARSWGARAVVNIQGDEPLIDTTTRLWDRDRGRCPYGFDSFKRAQAATAWTRRRSISSSSVVRQPVVSVFPMPRFLP